MEYVWFYGEGAGFEHALEVRVSVFINEQGYSPQSEPDGQDETSWHIVGYQNGVPVCTARVYSGPGGVWHIGRVAVLPVCRGRGVGLAMMAQAEQKAKRLGAARLVLSAQSDKTYFYKQAGFVPTGATSLDEGQPHTEMEKVL